MTTNAAGPVDRPTATRARMNRRQKVSFTDDDAARLRLAAQGAGLKPAKFIHRAVMKEVMAAIGTPTALPAPTAPQPADADPNLKRKFSLTPAEAALLKQAAKAAGLKQQDYVRRAVLAAISGTPAPKAKRNATSNQLAVELAQLALQVRKTGVNINQLAHQANAGLVPITRAEVMHFMNMQQRLLTMATAAIEKVLA